MRMMIIIISIIIIIIIIIIISVIIIIIIISRRICEVMMAFSTYYSYCTASVGSILTMDNKLKIRHLPWVVRFLQLQVCLPHLVIRLRNKYENSQSTVKYMRWGCCMIISMIVR